MDKSHLKCSLSQDPLPALVAAAVSHFGMTASSLQHRLDVLRWPDVRG